MDIRPHLYLELQKTRSYPVPDSRINKHVNSYTSTTNSNRTWIVHNRCKQNK
ncbi:hypothetical protein GIB67_040412 [Kingdonia uniflora]|uniref:Uncharacterized protein n=1 Tax=Kingdonia uniflora TaxID=39325 RepID=A0A7J7KXK4_9MAGN|nr:hypothetical protein GIB67_040412 [Kingdonia uniflora]